MHHLCLFELKVLSIWRLPAQVSRHLRKLLKSPLFAFQSRFKILNQRFPLFAEIAMSGKDCALPPALDLKLDKNVFKTKVIFFAIGLPLGAEFKRVSSRLHNFSSGYVALPKLNKI